MPPGATNVSRNKIREFHLLSVQYCVQYLLSMTAVQEDDSLAGGYLSLQDDFEHKF
jgi:hypothetical protein